MVTEEETHVVAKVKRARDMSAYKELPLDRNRWDEAIKENSELVATSMALLDAGIDCKIVTRDLVPEAYALLYTYEGAVLGTLWLEVAYVDKLELRKEFVRHTMLPESTGVMWLHKYTALLMYQKVLTWAALAGIGHPALHSNYKRRLAIGDARAMMFSKEPYLS